MTLHEIIEHAAAMRKAGILRFRCGDIEVDLSPKDAETPGPLSAPLFPEQDSTLERPLPRFRKPRDE